MEQQGEYCRFIGIGRRRRLDAIKIGRNDDQCCKRSPLDRSGIMPINYTYISYVLCNCTIVNHKIPLIPSLVTADQARDNVMMPGSSTSGSSSSTSNSISGIDISALDTYIYLFPGHKLAIQQTNKNCMK